MISGAATAALVELDPVEGGRRPALLAGLAQAGGSMLGPLIAEPLAEWAPDPLRLSFLAMLAATVAAGVCALAIPEPAAGTREPWRIQRPRVPRRIRRDFARVSLTAATVWATLALYLSIVPSYAGELLQTANLALLGAVSAIALASSCLSQVAAQRRRVARRSGQAVGLGLLPAGLVAFAAASPLRSLTVVVAGACAAEAGHGPACLNAQDELNAIAPRERGGEVIAAFIARIYAGVGAAVIATEILDLRVSLAVAVGSVAVVLSAVAAATAAWQAAGAATR